MHNVIKQIYEDIPSRLTKSYYGKKIMAAYNAYGSGYDFCRFYACENPDGSFGTVHIYNSSMVIAVIEPLSTSKLTSLRARFSPKNFRRLCICNIGSILDVRYERRVGWMSGLFSGGHNTFAAGFGQGGALGLNLGILSEEFLLMFGVGAIA